MRLSLPPLLSCLIAALPAVFAAGCSPATSSAHAAEPGSSNVPFPYAETEVSDLQARMVAGELDSVTLTGAYLKRIATLDRTGPRLRAVIELNPDALKEAAERDRERRNGRLRGPLHGIPILLKDNINAAPMATSAGSLALQGFRPDDAYLVRRLREAGAVVLGKTNLSEWANFRGNDSISGWSARGGQTRNPYRLSHSPCGSSSGSAVAVAANLASVAIGTENRWKHRLPRGDQRCGRPETDRRPGQPRRHHPDLLQPGHRGPDDPQRRRRRRRADRHRRPR